MSTIKKYIRYLLEDLQEAQQNIPLKPDYSAIGCTDVPPHIIEWDTTPFQTMESLFEIDKKAFPPAYRLTTEQILRLNEAIINLWKAFNFIPDLPESLPEQKKYELLVSEWKSEVQHLTEGHFHIEFCDYHPESCPLGFEYCKCKNFIEEDEELYFGKNDNKED